MDLLSGFNAIKGIHPLVVHFPISLTLVALFFEFIYLLTKKVEYRVFVKWLIFMSVASAISASLTGYLASEALGHESPGHQYVHGHRDVMLLFTGIMIVIASALLIWKPLKSGGKRIFLLTALIVASGLMTYGADKGGQLVFEFGTGVADREQKDKPMGINRLESHSNGDRDMRPPGKEEENLNGRKDAPEAEHDKNEKRENDDHGNHKH